MSVIEVDTSWVEPAALDVQGLDEGAVPLVRVTPASWPHQPCWLPLSAAWEHALSILAACRHGYGMVERGDAS